MNKTSSEPSLANQQALRNYLAPSNDSMDNDSDRMSSSNSSSSQLQEVESVRNKDQTFSVELHSKMKLNLEQNVESEGGVQRNSTSSKNYQMEGEQMFAQKNTNSWKNSITPKNMNSSLSEINYRKMLSIQVQKCKALQEALYNQSMKIKNFSSLVAKLKEQNKLLSKMVEKANVSEAKKTEKIKSIDEKIAKFKNQCKNSSMREQLLEKQVKRGRNQRTKLREENQKYRLFVSALYQSMGILNGKKIDSLPKLWEEWKEIFEEVSLSRCISKASKSK